MGLLVKPVVMRVGAMEKFPDRGVPRINITLDGVSLEEINAGSKETKYEGNKLDLYEGGEVREFEGVQVKGRGNATWMQEKKPYQIKFANKVDLFGLGKARKWVLLANALDMSNIRTDLAVRLEEMLGMKYRFEGEFVELYMDDKYEGLYYLTHVVEIGKVAVDLKEPLGVLVELDNLYWGVEKHYESGKGDHMVVKDVVNEGEEDKAMKKFMRDYNEFERAVVAKNYARVEELVDVESFVQYYLLSEFLVNPDAYWTSFYMYKDGMNDKIHAGPGWDFDLAFANRKWGNWMGEDFYLPTRTMVRRDEILSEEVYENMGLGDAVDWYGMSQNLSNIIFGLMEIPEFREEVARVYREKLLGRTEELISILENEVERVRWVIDVDNEKWQKGDFVEEVKKMVEWIKERGEFFEREYSEGEGVFTRSI